jgi:uncharacterized membrane protein YcaP (DUF421 family)
VNDIGWSMISDGWAPVVRTLALGTLAYIALVVLLRTSGKRTLSKMNAFDMVVTVAFGSTLASILTSRNVALAQGVTALGLLIALQFVCTFLAVRYRWFQNLIKSQPTLVFFQGQFLESALRRQRVTEEEVVAAIRENGVTEPGDVDAVVIESEGSLSVLRNNAASPDALARAGVEVEESLPIINSGR